MPKKKDTAASQDSSSESDEFPHVNDHVESDGEESTEHPKFFLSSVQKRDLSKELPPSLVKSPSLREVPEEESINSVQKQKIRESIKFNSSIRRLLVVPDNTPGEVRDKLNKSFASRKSIRGSYMPKPANVSHVLSPVSELSPVISDAIPSISEKEVESTASSEGLPKSTSTETTSTTTTTATSLSESVVHDSSLSKPEVPLSNASRVSEKSDDVARTTNQNAPLSTFLSGYNLLAEDIGGGTDTTFTSEMNLKSRKKFENIILKRKKEVREPASIIESLRLSNIFVNRRDLNSTRFPRNEFTTSKYTVWNFLPFTLFEQFARIANFIFLLYAMIQLIPGVSPFSVWTTLGPLLFILFVTSLKEGYEDYKRHVKDKAVNSVEYVRLDTSGELVSTKACDLCPGDIIIIDDEDFFPADMLLLMSSEVDGTCYVDTSNLDGETNLKELTALSRTAAVPTPLMLKSLRGTLTCQCPNKDLGSFHGVCSLYQESESSESRNSEGKSSHSAHSTALDATNTHTAVEASVDINNILLKGSQLKNSGWVAGMIIFTGTMTKLALNTNITKFKFSKIETELNRVVPNVFFFQLVLTLISCTLSYLFTLKPTSPEIIYEDNGFLYWLFSAFSYLVLYSFFVPQSMYVVFEFSRVIQSKFMESDLEMFEATGGAHAVTSTLNEELGNVQFMLSDKTGTLTKNNMICDSFCMGGYLYFFKDLDTFFPKGPKEPKDTTPKTTLEPPQNVFQFRKPTADSSLSPPKAIHSEKYGRQEENRAEVRVSPTAIPKQDILEKLMKDRNNGNVLTEYQSEHLKLFMKAVCLCNTVKPVEANGEILLRSESADEDALMVGGLRLGWQIIGRDKENILIREGFPDCIDNAVDPEDDDFTGHEYHSYSYLDVLPFTSARQRMTVVVKDLEDGKIYLFTKGADSKILSMTTEKEFFSEVQGQTTPENADRAKMLKDIYDHTQSCSKKGLRILLVAAKQVPLSLYNSWKITLEQANKNMRKRDEAIESAFSELEFGVSVVGATAVEDELQDDIKNDIQRLRDAGITVAMATGDKKETALIIGRNCGLLDDQSDTIDLTGNKSEVLLVMNTALKKYGLDTGNKVSVSVQCEADGDESEATSENTKKKKRGFVLIVDGKNVDYFLKKKSGDFIRLLTNARTAICCRMSPKQKATIVSVMKMRGIVCCAIGDGANDVSMIRESSVGVGVKGKEGNAAVYSADYVIGRFHHVIKLIMYHGRNNYRGNCYSIYTAFYSHLTFNLPLFYFSFFSGFSSQTIYSSFLLSTLFVFVSPIYAAVGWFYQDIPASVVISNPIIYKRSLSERLFTPKELWFYILYSIIHSVICFFIPYALFSTSQSLPGGVPLELWSMGYCVWLNVIIGIISAAMMNVPRWNISFGVMFGMSIVFIALVTLAIYWIVKDELHDSLPIVMRSPAFYLETLLVAGLHFVWKLFQYSWITATKPEPWRVFAEKTKLDRRDKKRGTLPVTRQ